MSTSITPSLEVLRSILEGGLYTDPPDEFTRLEQGTLAEQGLKIDLYAKKQNIREKKKYAKYIFVMLCVWLLIMLVILSISGLGRVPFTCLKFELSDAVLITLITTTTGNITAFFFVVTKHLFPSQS